VQVNQATGLELARTQNTPKNDTDH